MKVDPDALRALVDGWFARAALAELMGEPTSPSEQIALACLAERSDRTHAMLAAAAFRALARGAEASQTDNLRRVCLAAECFHAAWVIHSDIEMRLSDRGGRRTLHEEYDTAVALNVGDLLLGEGYRMISRSALPAERKAAMLTAAAAAHQAWAVSRGAELAGSQPPTASPGREAALRLGAICAGADAESAESLRIMDDVARIVDQDAGRR